MRLIDVAIPKFDDGPEAPQRPALEKAKSGAGAFRLPSGIFGSNDRDYDFDSDTEDEKHVDETPDTDDDESLEAQPGAVEVRPTPCSRTQKVLADERNVQQTPEMLQHVVEVDFRVDTLRASLYRSHDGVERELGNLTLEQFAMSFAMAKFTMAVDLSLRYSFQLAH